MNHLWKSIRTRLRRYDIVACSAGLMLIMLSIIGFASIWYEAKISSDLLIAQQVQELALIFKNINQECGIISFDHMRTYIDFLNVNSFEGSEVGAMNLLYPDKWKGAYLKDNFTIQGKVYEVVTTKHGSFIVPGYGVVLSNGLKVGKDIIINNDTDLDKMTLKGGVLNFRGKPLAIRIALQEKNIQVDEITSQIFDAQ